MAETNNKKSFRFIRAISLILVVICSLNLFALSFIIFRLWKIPNNKHVREALGRQLPPYSSYHEDYPPVIKFNTESMGEEDKQLLKEHLIETLTGNAYYPIQMIKGRNGELNIEVNLPPKIYDAEPVTYVIKSNLAGVVKPVLKFTPFEKLIARKIFERIAQWDTLKPDAKNALAEEIKAFYIIIALKATGDSLDYDEYITKNQRLLELLFRVWSWNDSDLPKDPNEVLQLKSEYFENLREQVRNSEEVVNKLLNTQTKE